MLLSKKFSSDLVWNFFSLGILAISGIVINIFIAKYYGSIHLGVFNQVFAIYILLSQLAIGGIHFSTLKHISYNQNKISIVGEITISALILSIAISLPISVITYLIKDFIGDLFGSPSVGFGLILIAPGLIFFSINKILFNVLNGLNLMRTYAIYQACRYIFIMFAIIGIYNLSYPGMFLSISLTFAEALLTILLLSHLCYSVIPIKKLIIKKSWFFKHIDFGFKGFLSGALSELNTRIDVLTIGYFMSDAMVGVYSFAAIIAEGIGQLSIVVRRNIDPLIGDSFSRNNFLEIELYSKKIKRTFPFLIFGVCLLIGLLYPFILEILIGSGDFNLSFFVLVILMSGVVLNSIYRPFLGILLQGNKPGHHTILVLIMILVNLIGNIALIPIFGIYGAAIATAFAYVLEGILIKFFSYRYLNVKI